MAASSTLINEAPERFFRVNFLEWITWINTLSMDRSLEPQTAMDIQISDLQSCLSVDHDRLRGWVQAALHDQGVSHAALSIVLVDDPAIRQINAQHLGHDYATDVITFPLSAAGDPELAGEIVISTQTAQATAALLELSAEHELALYTVHGVLHLCGFDDQDEESRRVMDVEQTRIVALLAGLPLRTPRHSTSSSRNAGGLECPQ